MYKPLNGKAIPEDELLSYLFERINNIRQKLPLQAELQEYFSSGLGKVAITNLLLLSYRNGERFDVSKQIDNPDDSRMSDMGYVHAVVMGTDLSGEPLKNKPFNQRPDLKANALDDLLSGELRLRVQVPVRTTFKSNLDVTASLERCIVGSFFLANAITTELQREGFYFQYWVPSLADYRSWLTQSRYWHENGRAEVMLADFELLSVGCGMPNERIYEGVVGG